MYITLYKQLYQDNDQYYLFCLWLLYVVWNIFARLNHYLVISMATMLLRALQWH